jgi:hypothetical protein
MPIVIAEWHQFHGPLLAFVVTLGFAVAARFLRVALLAAAAGGAGVIAGWYGVTGHLWMMPPLVSVNVLAELAAIALLIGLLCSWFGRGGRGLIAMLLAAIVVGWVLSGAPRHQAELRADWPIALGTIVAILLFARLLTDRAADPMRLALAGLTLAAALHVAGTPAVWVQLALVPGVAALAMFALPPAPGLTTLPVAVAVAALSCLVVIVLGRMPRVGFSPADAAALSPLPAIWLLPHTTERLRLARRAAPLAGCLLAGAIAVGCTWLARRLV